ncbi:broad-complex core protein isoforms 1/2/3/4/5 isoform X1 [Anabrus simplex]|uniref:broad-complex core protein isoforms 1/2/3/4/5 isoform X1 n=1 Tax=Anabrus simplex TaxID=316456 RepID=UPI0035A36CB1
MTSTLSTQRFCLRWNNHQSNLLSVFDQLLHDESFVDVTLAVEGRLLRAHKMVLSACSPYFQALFIGHPDKHPIVILKDVPFCDMRSLLEFMYRGEVSVDQDRLTAFLKVAESLRIKGLTEVNEEKCDLPSITSSLLSNVPNVPLVTTHTPSPPNLHRFTPGPASHKRAAPPLPPHSRSNPLLGSALTAPKRKRGRPRKLSGSSGNDSLPNLLPVTTVSQNPATTNGGNGENTSGSRSQTQTPSNMLDDNHSELETENRSGGMNAAEGQRSGGMNGAEVQRSGGINGAEGQRSGGINAAEGLKSEGMEVAEGQGQDQSDGPDYKRSVASGDRQPEGENGAGSTNIPSPNQLSTPLKDLIAKQIKQEPEPTPGPSSQDPGQAYLRPSSTQETDNYALDSSTYEFIDEHPSITFELCSTSDSYHSSGGGVTLIGDGVSEDQKLGLVVHAMPEGTAGVHFLSHEASVDDDGGGGCIVVTKCEETDSEELLQLETGGVRGKQELLEYLIREDGSVVCKWCGEVLPSRTHWYRHKYKFHVPSSGSSGAPSPASLFKCHRCNVFFKSRKGFTGHIASRHANEDNGKDISSNVMTRAASALDASGSGSLGRASMGRRSTRSSEAAAKGPDYERQREREEKLVADIIEKVRRECEAQGETVSRRGYSRRTTVMNS